MPEAKVKVKCIEVGNNLVKIWTVVLKNYIYEEIVVKEDFEVSVVMYHGLFPKENHVIFSWASNHVWRTARDTRLCFGSGNDCVKMSHHFAFHQSAMKGY